MKIFVTGASGFVGGAAARHLVAKGHEVLAMSRSDRSDAAIRATGATPVRCDLSSVTAEHMAGCEAVVHCAAFVNGWGQPDAWHRGNVLGTQAVLAAAQAAGVRRFVHIGTEAAIVHGQDLHDVDETYPLAPDSPFPYCATKAQAEQAVRAANAPGFETVVLRPRFIWGPGDTTLLPAIEEAAQAGRWVWIGGGTAMTSTVHIDNLVHAIELALERGRGGEAYFILDHGTVSMKEMITGMTAAKGMTLPDKTMPGWLAMAMARAMEWAWRSFNLKGAPPLTRHGVMVLTRDCTLNGDKARAELDYVPVVSREAGLARL